MARSNDVSPERQDELMSAFLDVYGRTGTRAEVDRWLGGLRCLVPSEPEPSDNRP